MKHLARTLILALAVLSGCSKSDLLTQRQFTREFADSLQKADPSLKLEMVADTELKITSASGHESSTFLDNAYDQYKQDPSAKAEVIQRFVTANLETIGTLHEEVDRTHIVPVIKDRAWLEETRQMMLSRGKGKAPESVVEDFAADLVIVYAEDSSNRIRYLGPDDLKSAKVERADLRQLAAANLKRLLPKIERQGTNGIYMVTAGGDYEASLLVLDSIWTNQTFDVQGEIVVGIPARDILLVTGSENPPGIEVVRHVVKKTSSESAYRLSPKLFVYRRGKFEEFR